MIDSLDRYGQSALMLSSKAGDAAVVRLLIALGAALDITAKYNLSALMIAVINNHSDIVEALLKAGANRSLTGTGAPGFFDKTALDLAEAAGRMDIAEMLRA